MNTKDNDYASILPTMGNREFVPHVIGVDFELPRNHNYTTTNFQSEIVLPEEHLLLRRITTRQCTKEIRLIHNLKLYYSSPGWLHFMNTDYVLSPSLLFVPGSKWMIDIRWIPSFADVDVNHINIALIGERVVPIQ